MCKRVDADSGHVCAFGHEVQMCSCVLMCLKGVNFDAVRVKTLHATNMIKNDY